MISVCIATYNGGKFIAEMLISILNQLGSCDEVIISDDCSNDNTIEIVMSLKDPRINIVINDSGRSVIRNFENALRASRGDVIFLADQDDIWIEKKVSSVVNCLNEFDLVVTDCKIVDLNLHATCESFFIFNGSRAGFIRNLYKNSYLGCCMAFRRKVLEYVLPFPKSIPMHDWWIGLVCELKGKVCFLDARLLLYRRHGQNVSATAGLSPYSLVRKLSWRMQLLIALFLRLLRVS